MSSMMDDTRTAATVGNNNNDDDSRDNMSTSVTDNNGMSNNAKTTGLDDSPAPTTTAVPALVDEETKSLLQQSNKQQQQKKKNLRSPRYHHSENNSQQIYNNYKNFKMFANNNKGPKKSTTTSAIPYPTVILSKSALASVSNNQHGRHSKICGRRRPTQICCLICFLLFIVMGHAIMSLWGHLQASGGPISFRSKKQQNQINDNNDYYSFLPPHVQWGMSTTTTSSSLLPESHEEEQELEDELEELKDDEITGQTQNDVTAEGIDFDALLNYIDVSAGIPGSVYNDKAGLTPDNFYILSAKYNDDDDNDDEKQDSNKPHKQVLLELSMNTYWKHPVSFRRRQLTAGLDYLESSLQLLQDLQQQEEEDKAMAINDEEEENDNNFISSKIRQLHHAIFDENISLPFFINWDASQNCLATPEYNNNEGENGQTTATTALTLNNKNTGGSGQTSCCSDQPPKAIQQWWKQQPENEESTTLLTQSPLPILRQVVPMANCQYFFLIPTASVLNLAVKNDNNNEENDQDEWAKRFQQQDDAYPWKDKLPQVLVKETAPNHSKSQQNLHQIIQANSDSFHVIPYVDKEEQEKKKGKKKQQQQEEMPVDEYQKFTAVLHTMENSLSSMFLPQLICQNSIVLVVHPQPCRDMFTQTLKPMVHYIPIEADYSNLKQQVSRVLEYQQRIQIMDATARRRRRILIQDENNNTSDEDDAMSLLDSVRENARQWCRQHLVYEKLQHHLLETLSTYMELLEDGNENWSLAWNAKRQVYLRGHFMLTRATAWSLPKSTVGAIKGGLRRDNKRYNATSQTVME